MYLVQRRFLPQIYTCTGMPSKCFVGEPGRPTPSEVSHGYLQHGQGRLRRPQNYSSQLPARQHRSQPRYIRANCCVTACCISYPFESSHLQFKRRRRGPRSPLQLSPDRPLHSPCLSSTPSRTWQGNTSLKKGKREYRYLSQPHLEG